MKTHITNKLHFTNNFILQITLFSLDLLAVLVSVFILM